MGELKEVVMSYLHVVFCPLCPGPKTFHVALLFFRIAKRVSRCCGEMSLNDSRKHVAAGRLKWERGGSCGRGSF